MHIGLLKHTYFGSTKVYTLNHHKVIEIKINISNPQNLRWLQQYNTYKSYHWKYCLFPDYIQDVQVHGFKNRKNPLTSLSKKVQYNDFFARVKNGSKFSPSEVLYIMYSVLMAWDQWRHFCDKFQYSTDFYAISSHHILLNPDGDVKLIIPFSSPQALPNLRYWAPENIPPSKQGESSWIKSIAFSIGLIGIEMQILKISDLFYTYKNEHTRWMVNSCADCSMELLNLCKLLIDQNPWTRLKIQEFRSILAPYKKQIINCKEFKLSREQSSQKLLQYLKAKKK